MLSTYLSPRRFALAGFGVDTSSLTQAQLRQALRRATAKVDAYVNGPSLPDRHDLRGGTVTAEQHPWIVANPLLQTIGSRRVYLNHRPVQSVSSFVVKFTNSYQVTLDAAADLYVNHIEGYAEVVAVAAVVSGVYPVGINFGLYQPVAEIDYTYGWQFAVSGDELEADTTALYYASAANWDPAVPPTIYRDGVEEDPAHYTVNYDDGSILFTTGNEPGPREAITADYVHLLPNAVEEAVGIIAADEVVRSRNRARMPGLSSIKVAEVALTALSPTQYASRNGIDIPVDAARLLDGFVIGTAGGG